ncbi:UNVERIFIED_CONTAM: putative MFS family arabinose efflux permease [Paenibacillus sp. PvR008]
MNVSGLQVYAVTLAQRYVPNAVDVVSVINIAAFLAGITLGSYLGGVVTDSIGLIHHTLGWRVYGTIGSRINWMEYHLERRNQGN